MTGRELATGELAELVEEIRATRRRLQDLLGEIRQIVPTAGVPPPRPVLALLAVDMHSYYTALETLLTRLLVGIEGRAPQGESAHAQLLREACRSVEGVRPALLAPDLRDTVDELRRFRHFFRHAYALELRHDRLRIALDPLLSRGDDIDSSLASVEAFVRSLIDQLRG